MARPPRIIKPSEALLRVRDRNAPPARLGAGVHGWVDWELVDRRGRAIRGGQSPNLWLNQGLDALAVPSSANTPILGLGSGGSGATLFGVTHAAVGTSSTVVDPTQTSLGAELARSSTVFGAPSGSRVSNGVYNLTKTFVFDFGVANGVLTEWGMARAASDGLLTRALFTDELGTPISITKTSDYQLRLTYTLNITLTPVALTPASMTITGIGVINGSIALLANSNANGRGDLAFFGKYAAAVSNSPPNAFLTATPDWSYTGNVTVFDGSSHRANGRSANSYVTGDYARKHSYTWGVNNGNLAGIRQIAVDSDFSGAFVYAGMTFLIDAEDAFTKTNENTLSITDLFTVSWGRA